MAMFRLIIEKELRDIIGSAKFAVTFAVCALLILLTFFIGARSFQLDQARYDAAQAANIRQLNGVTDWLNVRQYRIFLPPNPLAALVSGISNDIGQTTEVQGRGELSATDSRYEDEPIFAVFRFLDLEFIFQVVLSLFAILFAYDSINGEKERGTLRLTFASPVPRDIFILGKLVGSTLALTLPLLVPLLLGCILLVVMGIPMGTDSWIRLALIIGTGLLYCSAFLALSVAISALTFRSPNAFLLLLVVWIGFVFIIPRASVLIAGRAVDVPSVDEIASQKARYNAQLWTEDRNALAGFKPSTTGNPGKMMQEFQQFMQKAADERDKKTKEFSRQLNEERWNRQAAQEHLALGLARISPAATFSLAAATLAGTSLDLKVQYRKATEAYQAAFAAFMVEKTGMNPGGSVVIFRMTQDNGKKPEPINPYELPAFNYQPALLADVFPAALIDLSLIMIFNLLFFIVAYVAFLRYDLR